jgi:endonuclease/exonuclease/phosphatase family metal-dependent hydrolase
MSKLKELFTGLAVLSTLGACLGGEPDTATTTDAEATDAEVTPDSLAEVGSAVRRPGSIVVMTRNQYLGADLTPVIAAPDAATFNREVIAALDQIAANRFAERAFSLALEVAVTRPDVIGLQEVFSFKRNGANGAAPFRDHLADTQRALALLGQRYTVAAQVQNMSLTIPVDFSGDGVIDTAVDVLDRDVILVREGLTATPVPFSAACTRPSLDGGPGCNFQIIATAPTPVGDLAIQRGFVGIDVTVNGRAHRVIDTHLEVPDLDPTNPLSAAIQAAQAQELIALVTALTPADRTLVLLGDFNSSPEDEIVQVGDVTIVPPYVQLAAAGFTDAWLVDPRVRSGFTCCQAEDLRNAQSQHNERIDLILSREAPDSVRAEVLGTRQFERTPLSRLWPSDHAGVVGRLQF